MTLSERARAFARRQAFVLAVLALCALAYGPLLPTLGFYWDDWQVVFHTQAGRVADLASMYAYDRPYSTWTALLSAPLLDTSPLAWHLFALLLRALLAVVMAWALGLAWPRRRVAIYWAALLFSVYPAYTQQPVAVAFSQHLIAYTLFFVSLGAMLLAARRPGRFWPLTVLALATQLIHLGVVEHFAGLELLRPILLLLVLKEQGQTHREAIRDTLRHWLPYLLALLLFTLWRLVWLDLPTEPHPIRLFDDLRANPIGALLAFAQEALQGSVHVLVTSWQRTLQPEFFDFGDRARLFAWGLAGLAGLAAYAWGRRMPVGEDEERRAPDLWIGLGPLAVFLGLLPIWLIGEQVLETGYNEHLVLPALLGGALFWVGLAGLVDRQRHRVAFLAVLIALALGLQVRVANELRHDWRSQQRFYHQLAWRAPDVRAGTAFAAFGRLSPYTQNSALAAAINTMYPQSRAAPRLDYWHFDLGISGNVETIQHGERLEQNYRGMQFEAEDSDSLLLYFLPEVGCLWLLTPLDAHNAYLPTELRALAANSNPARILRERGEGEYAPPEIFGEPDEDGWCYHYQRAELARQFGDWERVLQAYEQAFAAGHSPDNSVELLGLVEAYANLGEWSQALAASQEMAAQHSSNQPLLCALWGSLAAENGFGAPPDVLAQVRQSAHCG